MSDATERTGSLPTDVGAPRQKLFNGALAVVKRIDTTDPDQVFDLASVLATASDRRLMQATLKELRAICAYSVRAGVIASHACRFVKLSDMPLDQVSATDFEDARSSLVDAVRNDQEKKETPNVG